MSENPESPRSLVPYEPGPALPAELRAPDANLLEIYLQRFDRERTRAAYFNDLVQFFGRSVLSVAEVREATFMHVNRHIAELEAEGRKPSTIKRRIAGIRGFFEWLEALGIIEQNPARKQLLRKVRSTRSVDRHVVFLSADQAGRLLAATSSAGEAAVRDHALLNTLLHCVLRRSEAAAMDVHHVRPLGHYWVLDLPETKGGADQYVKVPAHLVEEIEHHKRHYGITNGPLWRSLSNNNRDGRLTPQSIYEIVRRAATEAGLPDDIGAHTLRHTGCTLAIEAGASLQQVQSHARHKNLETTMMYVHQRDRLRDSAADFIHVKDPRRSAE